MAQMVAIAREIVVSGIVERIQLRPREQLSKVASAQREKRSPERSAALLDAGESEEPAARAQAEKDRLDLVVQVVGGEDPVGAEPLADVLERLIPDPPGSRLDVLSRALFGRHVTTFEGVGETQSGGQGSRRFGAFGGASVHPVIDVDQVNLDRGFAASSRRGRETQGESQRVDAAGESHHPRPARAGGARRIDLLGDGAPGAGGQEVGRFGHGGDGWVRTTDLAIMSRSL